MRTLLLFLAISTVTFLACNRGSKDETESSSDSKTPENPAEALTKAMEELGGGKASEPVDHRKLKEMLREKLNGFERTRYESQSAGAMGFNFSNAEADYASGDKRINVSFTDTGGAGMALMSMAAWSSMQLDKEDQNGWERTSTWKGFKSFEKYNKQSNSSELALIVENRFIVTLNGSNVDMDDLKDFADDLDIEDLKKMI